MSVRAAPPGAARVSAVASAPAQPRPARAVAAQVEPTMASDVRAVPSPCIGVCMLDDEGCCFGCHRTAAEIAGWPGMEDDERLRLMDQVLPARAAARER